MAKDGTQRGGARIGAGRKSKALTDKISEGESAAVLQFPEGLVGVDVPPVKEYLKAKQKNKNGKDLLQISKRMCRKYNILPRIIYNR